MENNQSQFESLEVKLTSESIDYLKETVKWSYFISIIGFIGVGFMVVGGLTMSTVLASLGSLTGELYGAVPAGFLGALYLILALIYFFPVYYLFNFSRKMKLALKENDTTTLTESFKNLKSHYKFVGILTLIIVILYGVLFLIGLLGGLAGFIMG